MRRRAILALAVAAALGLVATLTLMDAAGSRAQVARYIVVQSTTSTENSGLFKHLLPIFTAKTGIEVRVVAVGTGQAIKNARNGDGDVLFVHDKPSEEKFVAEGWGVKRFDVMYNDFVVIGPAKDPAGIAGAKDVVAAFKKIADAKAPFVSRGDDSGTHKAELRLWQDAGVDAKAASGTWYREAGSGMGATINTGVGMGAYVFTDRATWSSFKNRGDCQDRGRGRQEALQPVRRHAGEPGQASQGEAGRGPGLHRLGAVGGGAGRHPLVPDQRRAAVLPQRQPDGVRPNSSAALRAASAWHARANTRGIGLSPAR